MFQVQAGALHVHCVVSAGDYWNEQLVFRDYLRAHPEVAAAYYHFKEDRAARLTKAQYTEAKSLFIDQVLASAMGGNRR